MGIRTFIHVHSCLGKIRTPVFLSLFGSFLRFIWQIKATIPLESLNNVNGIVEQNQWNRSTKSMESFLRFVVLVSGDWWFLQAKTSFLLNEEDDGVMLNRLVGFLVRTCLLRAKRVRPSGMYLIRPIRSIRCETKEGRFSRPFAFSAVRQLPAPVFTRSSDMISIPACRALKSTRVLVKSGVLNE